MKEKLWESFQSYLGMVEEDALVLSLLSVEDGVAWFGPLLVHCAADEEILFQLLMGKRTECSACSSESPNDTQNSLAGQK